MSAVGERMRESRGRLRSNYGEPVTFNSVVYQARTSATTYGTAPITPGTDADVIEQQFLPRRFDFTLADFGTVTPPTVNNILQRASYYYLVTADDKSIIGPDTNTYSCFAYRLNSTSGDAAAGFLRTDTVEVEAASETVDPITKAVSVPSYAAGVEVAGQLVPKSPGAVYAEHGIIAKNPFQFLFATDDVDLFHIGNRVTMGDRVFFVMTEPRLFTSDPSGLTNHGDVILEEERASE
jgi:hypothetical protein